MAPPAPQPPLLRGFPFEAWRWVAVVLVVLGPAALFLGAGRIVFALGQSASAPSYPTPMDRTLSLPAGHRVVFQQVPAAGGPSPGPALLTSGSVSVAGRSGELAVRGLGSTSETLTRQGVTYRAVAQFEVAKPGSYRVRVEAARGSRVLVAPGVFGLAPWLVLMVSGIFTLTGGMILIWFVNARRPSAQVASPRKPAEDDRPYGPR